MIGLLDLLSVVIIVIFLVAEGRSRARVLPITRIWRLTLWRWWQRLASLLVIVRGTYFPVVSVVSLAMALCGCRLGLCLLVTSRCARAKNLTLWTFFSFSPRPRFVVMTGLRSFPRLWTWWCTLLALRIAVKLRRWC